MMENVMMEPLHRQVLNEIPKCRNCDTPMSLCRRVKTICVVPASEIRAVNGGGTLSVDATSPRVAEALLPRPEYWWACPDQACRSELNRAGLESPYELELHPDQDVDWW